MTFLWRTLLLLVDRGHLVTARVAIGYVKSLFDQSGASSRVYESKELKVSAVCNVCISSNEHQLVSSGHAVQLRYVSDLDKLVLSDCS